MADKGQYKKVRRVSEMDSLDIDIDLIEMDNRASTNMPIETLEEVKEKEAYSDNVDDHEPEISPLTRHDILDFFEKTSNNLTIRELEERDITKMIQTQKEYERYGTYRCGHKILYWLSKCKILIFNILIFGIGLFIAKIFFKPNKDSTPSPTPSPSVQPTTMPTLSPTAFYEDAETLYDFIVFYTCYLSFGLLMFTITQILVYFIMKLLRKFITNTWKVFYIKDIRNRLYFAILCTLWLVGLPVFAMYIYPYNPNDRIFKLVECLMVSAAAFLVSYLFVRYIALTSYFSIFRQRARKLKAYAVFLEIMLGLKPGDTVFSMPLMNFLIDFPTNEQQKEAIKANSKHVAFQFDVESIKIIEPEKKKIDKMARSFFSDEQFDGVDDANGDQSDLYNLRPESYHGIDDIDGIDGDDIDAFDEILASELYTVDLNKNLTLSTNSISQSGLKKLASLISCLIMIRLTKKAKKTIKSIKPINSNSTSSEIHQNITKSMRRFQGRVKNLSNAVASYRPAVTKKSLELENYENHIQIDERLFLVLFKEYDMANKRLLIKLGKSAWQKFKDESKQLLTPRVLSINLIRIIQDLLELKQSVDSYVVIIKNLQQMIDVVTPILLIFVYLYIFSWNFQETIALYASSFAIIGFFGASYFGSVFASVSFIIALNPFLVGDTIWFNNDFYKVREISLTSCVFQNCRTGWSHTFQNKLLSSMSHPIINLSRSGIMIYRFILYFKSDLDNEILYDFNQDCKERIKQTIFNELSALENKRNGGKMDKSHRRVSNASFADLKSIEKFVDELRFKAVALDEYGRKQVFIELKYEQYSWDVRTLAFNCITKVANHEKYKQYLCDNLPLRMEEGVAVEDVNNSQQTFAGFRANTDRHP